MPTANDNIRKILPRILKDGTERTLYKPLCVWLEQFAAEEPLKLKGVEATSEESALDSDIGFPDITIRHGGEIAGWIEVKLPDKPLNHQSYKLQFKRYQESLENIIYTNLREWELWQWDRGEDQKSKRIKSVIFDLQEEGADPKEFLNLLTTYFEYAPTLAKTPKQLAIALARKARFLSKQIEEALVAAVESKEKNNELMRLKKTFQKILIADIVDHQFANMVAETVAYSLFLARLEHDERGAEDVFTLTTAVDYLPKNVPILSDLFGLISRISRKIPNAYQAATALLEQLNRADIHRIRQKLVEHKPGEDPVIQFYEPFLEAYDRDEKNARGVFYTPKPVVDYIIRSVDELLAAKFPDCPQGLASDNLLLLDPATGSGTFLMSAIQQIHSRLSEKNRGLGKDVLAQEFRKTLSNHILPNFYGFELMVAPYAIAHLKLTLEAERLGFTFKEDDRFKVYLANTLDDPQNKPTQSHAADDFGSLAFPAIAEESEKARAVKAHEPILVITGNPPYSNFGQMNNGEWIMGLIEDYKHGIEEKKFNWDDYVKFIRFAQWKLEQTGQGIFAMITNHTFLDAITLRGMRGSLLKSFDEIYIFNLHGNSLRGEVCPDGSDDENVFPIHTVGVSINFFIKLPKHQDKPKIFYQDLWGSKKSKFMTLLENTQATTKWDEIDVEKANKQFLKTRWGKSLGILNPFLPLKQQENLIEYGDSWGIKEIFRESGPGIKTERDGVTIKWNKQGIEETVHDFRTLDESKLRQKYELGEDSRDWQVLKAKSDVIKNQGEQFFQKIQYRPFDVRHTWYSGKTRGFIGTPGYSIMQHLQSDNLALLTCRQQADGSGFKHAHCSNGLTECCAVSLKTSDSQRNS